MATRTGYSVTHVCRALAPKLGATRDLRGRDPRTVAWRFDPVAVDRYLAAREVERAEYDAAARAAGRETEAERRERVSKALRAAWLARKAGS